MIDAEYTCDEGDADINTHTPGHNDRTATAQLYRHAAHNPLKDHSHQRDSSYQSVSVLISDRIGVPDALREDVITCKADHDRYGISFFFFKQKTAYEITV